MILSTLDKSRKGGAYEQIPSLVLGQRWTPQLNSRNMMKVVLCVWIEPYIENDLSFCVWPVHTPTTSKEVLTLSASTSPLPYTGNKSCIVNTILSVMPKHTVYIDPCMGSAEVFFRKPRAEKEILNDYNGDLVNLFRVIQPPIMKLLTTKKERQIVMKPLREVSKKEKIIFPIVVTIFVALLVPSAAPLIACLMLGNLFKECGVTERLSKTVQNELINIVTIFLGVSVGATATGTTFLSLQTIKIMAMGVVAFSFGTAGGVLLAKFMNLFLKEKINPLIGSAGVSAVPMAARVSQMVGQKYNPGNFLLMHAMGPNVAGVIGSAIAAGVLISLYG